MKNLIFLSVIFLIGCDNGQRTRLPVSGNSDSSTYTIPNPTNIGNTGTLPNGTTSNGSGSSSTTTTGFESCDLTQKYYAATFGNFGLCQSSQDETMVKFRPNTTLTDSRVCLIPLFRNGSGSSMPIGMPQCTYPKKDQEMLGKLYKSTNYQNIGINSVLVIRETLLPNYYACINGYTNFIQSNCPNNPPLNCQQAAQQYQATTCNNFVTTYQNQSYVSVKLKD
ncbi:MAG: hypothetical protein AB7I27_11595 [Bacteriovoracaceae bacterium]